MARLPSAHHASRRYFLGGCGCSLGAALLPGNARATIDPATIAPSVVPGYTPQDKDERGLWMQIEQAEEEAAKSNFLIRDPALNKYLKDLCCKLAGDFCPDVRVYVFRTPYFNASMYPNGMMHIWSGLLLRCQNEAQLSAVLGHEIGHYLRQHSLKRWRDVRNKTSAYGLIALPLAVATAGLGNLALEMGLMQSLFANSRDDEREADAFGLKLMEKNSLAPEEASKIWAQLIEEREQTAKAQGKKKAKREPVFFATHPQSAERMSSLAADARKIMLADKNYESGQDRYAASVGPLRNGFFDDQLKLEDYGGTSFLLEQLARSGWTSELHFFKGELLRQHGQDDDMIKSIDAYRAALAMEAAPVEAHRGLGYALLKTGQRDAARDSFKAYLALRPDAPDKAMIQFNLQ
jgi:beta-barrel assembly-enhancing protease